MSIQIRGQLSRRAFRTGDVSWARLSWIVTAAAAAVLLFALCERLSAAAPIESDTASAVLQGHAIASGNVLLRGWTLSRASFLATDLPFYFVGTLVRGVSPEAARDAGAAIYTLVILSACLLARGQARGRDAVLRMAIPLMLLVAPAAGTAAGQLLLGPFHVGTTLFLVLVLILVDRARHRLIGVAGVWALLTLAMLSDMLALFVGAVPLAVVFGARHLGRRRPRWPDSAMLLAVALALPTSVILARALHGLGGFTTLPVEGRFVQMEDLSLQVALTAGGILLVFGVDFLARSFTAPQATLVHLVGLIVVAAVWFRTILSWRGDDRADLLSQVLAAGMAVDVAAYLFSNQPVDLGTSRYLFPLLVFGAVLAGRHSAGWLSRHQARPLALAVAVAYAGVLAVNLKSAAPTSDEAALRQFLERQNLTYGVSGYWDASSTTVATGNQVRIRAINVDGRRALPYRWEASDAWYDPSISGNDARFMLHNTSNQHWPDRKSVEGVFGPPSREYRIGRYEVWIWERNLLHDLDTVPT